MQRQQRKSARLQRRQGTRWTPFGIGIGRQDIVHVQCFGSATMMFECIDLKTPRWKMLTPRLKRKGVGESPAMV